MLRLRAPVNVIVQCTLPCLTARLCFTRECVGESPEGCIHACAHCFALTLALLFPALRERETVSQAHQSHASWEAHAKHQSAEASLPRA